MHSLTHSPITASTPVAAARRELQTASRQNNKARTIALVRYPIDRSLVDNGVCKMGDGISQCVPLKCVR